LTATPGASPGDESTGPITPASIGNSYVENFSVTDACDKADLALGHEPFLVDPDMQKFLDQHIDPSMSV